MTPDQAKSTYRRMLAERGEVVAIRRYTGAGVSRPRFEVEVKAVVSDFGPQDLVGAITQGDRKLIVMVEDLIRRQFAIPVTTNDKAMVRGRECAITAADDSTRRIAGELIAYELTVRG